MPWKYVSDDDVIEIIVSPDFRGDLLEIAKSHVVYIIDTPQNHEAISACWRLGAQIGLCEVNRTSGAAPNDREGNLIRSLQLVDLHHYPYPGFVVRGVAASASLVQALAEKGISIIENTIDGFVATGSNDAPIPGIWALTDFLEKEGKG